MKKIRHFLAIFALVVTLGGFSFQGIAANSLATVAAHQHTSSQVAFKLHPPCPLGGEMDC